MGFLERFLDRPKPVVSQVSGTANGKVALTKEQREARNLTYANDRILAKKARYEATNELREACRAKELGLSDHENDDAAAVGLKGHTIWSADSHQELGAFDTQKEAMEFVARLTPNEDGTYSLDRAEDGETA